MTALNTTDRPRNRSRARAYPASESKKTRPTVTDTATTTELVNHSAKSDWKSLSRAAVVNGSGSSVSGCATASGFVLNAVTSWTTNGYR